METDTKRTPPAVGERVVLVDDVERYPHFTVLAGQRGRVVASVEDGVSVRMDLPVPGAEEWDNEVVFTAEDAWPEGDAVTAFHQAARVDDGDEAETLRERVRRAENLLDFSSPDEVIRYLDEGNFNAVAEMLGTNYHLQMAAMNARSAMYLERLGDAIGEYEERVSG